MRRFNPPDDIASPFRSTRSTNDEETLAPQLKVVASEVQNAGAEKSVIFVAFGFRGEDGYQFVSMSPQAARQLSNDLRAAVRRFLEYQPVLPSEDEDGLFSVDE